MPPELRERRPPAERPSHGDASTIRVHSTGVTTRPIKAAFPTQPTHRVAILLAVAGAVAILGLTLSPAPDQASYSALTPLLCLVCGDTGGADVSLNFLLFVPMATGLRLLGWSWLRVVAAAALLSLTVEALQ